MRLSIVGIDLEIDIFGINIMIFIDAKHIKNIVLIISITWSTASSGTLIKMKKIGFEIVRRQQWRAQ